MFLSKPDILEKLDEIIMYPDLRDRKVREEVENLVQEASLELRLGQEVFITKDRVPKLLAPEDQYVSIPSGEFALLTTEEKLSIPGDLTAFISIKLRYKILGLVNISGFHVDPLFKGRIVFSVYNVGPVDIVLRYNDPIFLIFFATVSTRVEGNRKGNEFQNQEHLKTETVMSLRAGGLSLTTLENRLSRLETTLKIIVGLFVPLFALVIALILKKG